jgi:hypothetical protein
VSTAWHDDEESATHRSILTKCSRAPCPLLLRKAERDGCADSRKEQQTEVLQSSQEERACLLVARPNPRAVDRAALATQQNSMAAARKLPARKCLFLLVEGNGAGSSILTDSQPIATGLPSHEGNNSLKT